MYDWPEVRAEVDAQWEQLRCRLRRRGVDAPERLARRNGDLPPVPGGIRGRTGEVLAPDPATLPCDELDLDVLWRHPDLLLAQTCWGPMENGLGGHVQVVGQPDYSAFEGGSGEHYSSAVIMRRGADPAVTAPADGRAVLPLDRMRGSRLIYNGLDSMSGLLALERDLAAQGGTLALFASRAASGGHRASLVAVAEGRADVAAIDCRSWHQARRFEPAAKELTVAGWTARRKGLPYITALATPADTIAVMRDALSELGMLAMPGEDAQSSRRSSSG
jgi:ABC-type phosphate/phosphonate transport system substrate-binding protein